MVNDCAAFWFIAIGGALWVIAKQITCQWLTFLQLLGINWMCWWWCRRCKERYGSKATSSRPTGRSYRARSLASPEVEGPWSTWTIRNPCAVVRARPTACHVCLLPPSAAARTANPAVAARISCRTTDPEPDAATAPSAAPPTASPASVAIITSSSNTTPTSSCNRFVVPIITSGTVNIHRLIPIDVPQISIGYAAVPDLRVSILVVDWIGFITNEKTLATAASTSHNSAELEFEPRT